MVYLKLQIILAPGYILLTKVIVQVEFHPTNDGIIYFYNNLERNLVYKSNDTGKTFSTTKINNTLAKIAVTANVVFFISKGLFKSTDSGVNFTFVSNSFNNISNIGRNYFAVNSTNNVNLFVGGIDVLNSIDGGANFIKRTHWSLRECNEW